MTVGQRIAQLRKQNGLSQEALGAELGVSRQAISKWESDATLPEIEKLIALAKRFSVTVGCLLGVEEEVQQTERSEQPAQAQPEDAATEPADAQTDKPTEAEVLERYLNSLPRQKAVSKRTRILFAVAAVLLAAVVVIRFSDLERGLGEARNDINILNQTVSQLENRIDGLTNEISNQVEQAMQQEYGVLANWELNLTKIDYEAGLGEVELRAVLKNGVEDASQLRFYAECSDKTIAEPTESQWDGENYLYTAKVQLPLTESSAAYYLATPDGTVCIAKNYEHNLTNLAETTQPSVELTLFNTSDSRRIRFSVSALVYVPKEMEHVLGQLEPPEVSMWLATKDERLSPLPVRYEESSVQPFMYDTSVEGPASSFEPYQNETLFMEYEITFSNGYKVTGRCNQTLTMGSDGSWVYGDEGALIHGDEVPYEP